MWVLLDPGGELHEIHIICSKTMLQLFKVIFRVHFTNQIFFKF